MTFSLFLAESGGIGDMIVETGRTFGFNGWLFLSQCFSFSLVALLLYKFAYGPILKVLEERRQKIEQGLEDAKKSKELLAASERDRDALLAKANAEAQRMIEEARASVQTIKDRGNQQATDEAEGIRRKAREDAQSEHARMLGELRREVTRLVVDTTGKVVNKTLSDDDRRRLSDEANRELAA